MSSYPGSRTDLTTASLAEKCHALTVGAKRLRSVVFTTPQQANTSATSVLPVVTGSDQELRRLQSRQREQLMSTKEDYFNWIDPRTGKLVDNSKMSTKEDSWDTRPWPRMVTKKEMDEAWIAFSDAYWAKKEPAKHYVAQPPEGEENG